MQSFADTLTLISNCIFNYNELIPGDINDDICILKENITDEEGMQNDKQKQLIPTSVSSYIL